MTRRMYRHAVRVRAVPCLDIQGESGGQRARRNDGAGVHV